MYSETRLPTASGLLRLRVYRHSDGSEPVAVIGGDHFGSEGTAVRIHSACFTSESLGSLKCDCREQLNFSLAYIAREGGVVVYLPQEGRGIGLADKIRAYSLQELGYNTIDANRCLGLPSDARSYESAALILRDLGISSVRLMTNNPRKIEALRNEGIGVVERIPVNIAANEHSRPYLTAKYMLMGHLQGPEECAYLPSPLHPQESPGSCRPLIHINCAVDENGAWTHPDGRTDALSCPQDWQRVHSLREQYDAVAVGSRTWNLDKPRLTARSEYLGREPLRQPARIVFAGGQRLEAGTAGSLYVVASGHPGLQDARVIRSEGHDLKEPLNALFDLGIRSILVEGGLALAGSFILQGFADRVTVFVRTQRELVARRAAALALPGLALPGLLLPLSTIKLGDGFVISYRECIIQNQTSSFVV